MHTSGFSIISRRENLETSGDIHKSESVLECEENITLPRLLFQRGCEIFVLWFFLYRDFCGCSLYLFSPNGSHLIQNCLGSESLVNGR